MHTHGIDRAVILVRAVISAGTLSKCAAAGSPSTPAASNARTFINHLRKHGHG